jgi:hypothetical protein
MRLRTSIGTSVCTSFRTLVGVLKPIVRACVSSSRTAALAAVFSGPDIGRRRAMGREEVLVL